MLVPLIGLFAAAFTSLSYVPQVLKALPRGSTDDLSLKTLAVLAAGLALWVSYGLFKSDYVLVTANAVGFGLVVILITLKLRDVR